MVNRILVSDIKFMFLRAQEGQLVSIFSKCIDHFSAAFCHYSRLNSSSSLFARRHYVPICLLKYSANRCCFLPTIGISVVHTHSKGAMWKDFWGSARSTKRARMLPDDINAIENCARCNRGLDSLPGEVNVRFIVLLNLLTARKAVFVVENRIDSPKISPRSSGVGASRQDKRNGELHSL